MLRKIFFILLMMYPGLPVSGQVYNGISYYLVAHAEDWELFMGNAAWNDIRTFHERGYPFYVNTASPTDGKGVFPNGLKVVIVNITAGSFYPDYLKEGCYTECDYTTPVQERTPLKWWEANENSENKSICFAGSRPKISPKYLNPSGEDDGFGPFTGTPGAPELKMTTVNGHQLTKYSYKNIVVYYLRIDETSLLSGGDITTVDRSTVYKDYHDLVATVQDIYNTETFTDVGKVTVAEVNTFETDTLLNPGDHAIHYFAGKLALDAAVTNAHCPQYDFSFNYYPGFHLADMPINLDNRQSNPQMEHKAGLYATYALGMLLNNGIADTGNFGGRGKTAYDFMDKEYSREEDVNMTYFCPDNTPVCPDTTFKKLRPFETSNMKLFPNPANDHIAILFDNDYPPLINVRIIDINNRPHFQEQNISLDQTNTMYVNISGLIDGAYELLADDGSNVFFRKMFIVHHAR